MSEKNAYTTFRDNVRKPGDRIDRMENGVGVGMPDINFCFQCKEGWLELKCPMEPKRAATPLFGSNHNISIDQRNWFLRQTKAGGFAAFLIMTDQRWLLIAGNYAERINGLTVNELIHIAAWHTPRPIKDKAQWDLLRNNLLTLR